MSQAVMMHLQLDAELRASFQRAAESEHTPVEALLERLMRDYLLRHPDQGSPPSFTGEDRNLDDLVLQALGWRDTAFGAE